MAYTSGDILVRSVMTASSGLPEDSIINDWAFQKPTAATGADLTTAMGLVADFFEDVQASAFSVGTFISNAVNRSATHELQAWGITVPPMGSPDQVLSWIGPPAATSGFGVPTEVAGVLSFHADQTVVDEEVGATRPRARRRGRVYIGPLSREAIDVANPPYMLSADFNTTLRQAAVALYDAADAAGIPWSVWSRADQLLRPVIAGWTDNAPDTQRRRGPAATSRVVWTG